MKYVVAFLCAVIASEAKQSQYRRGCFGPSDLATTLGVAFLCLIFSGCIRAGSGVNGAFSRRAGKQLPTAGKPGAGGGEAQGFGGILNGSLVLSVDPASKSLTASRTSGGTRTVLTSIDPQTKQILAVVDVNHTVTLFSVSPTWTLLFNREAPDGTFPSTWMSLPTPSPQVSEVQSFTEADGRLALLVHGGPGGQVFLGTEAAPGSGFAGISFSPIPAFPTTLSELRVLQGPQGIMLIGSSPLPQVDFQNPRVVGSGFIERYTMVLQENGGSFLPTTWVNEPCLGMAAYYTQVLNQMNGTIFYAIAASRNIIGYDASFLWNNVNTSTCSGGLLFSLAGPPVRSYAVFNNEQNMPQIFAIGYWDSFIYTLIGNPMYPSSWTLFDKTPSNNITVVSIPRG